jgi:hypothetical protein
MVHPELTPMIRRFGLVLFTVFSIGSSAPAEAQIAAELKGSGASTYGIGLDQIEPYGGFGLETMQTPFVGTVVVDRFGMLHGTALAQPLPGVTAARPHIKGNRYSTSGRAARAGYSLPTGSLNWAGANGVILYSPALRYQNYGGGYGRGPYGSIDCGMMFKGMSLGY